ncbi:MAG: PAS domain-containing protein [Ignavibacteriales bacterium]
MRNEQLINELTEVCQQIAELEVWETDRRQAEKELKEVQERFSRIYNSSKDAIGYVNLEGTLLDVNDSFLRLTGYSREELLNGRRYQDITPEEYHEYESKMVEKALRTGEPVEYEKEYIRKDGSRVPILLTVFMVKGTDNKPLGLAAIIKDLIDRRVLYEKSQKQSEELKTLYEDLNRRN